MSNTFSLLNINTSGGVGTAHACLQGLPGKTIIAQNADNGVVLLQASMDGVTFADLMRLGGAAAEEEPPRVVGLFHSVRVRWAGDLDATGAVPMVGIGYEIQDDPAGQNVSVSLDVPVAAGNGSSTNSKPWREVRTIGVSGTLEAGALIVQGSGDQGQQTWDEVCRFEGPFSPAANNIPAPVTIKGSPYRSMRVVRTAVSPGDADLAVIVINGDDEFVAAGNFVPLGTATGTASVAAGSTANANAAIQAVAVGDNARVSSTAAHGIAIGGNAYADVGDAAGLGAIAIGGDPEGWSTGAWAEGDGAIALGANASAYGNGSIAIGQGATANDVGNCTIGSNTPAKALTTLTINANVDGNLMQVKLLDLADANSDNECAAWILCRIGGNIVARQIKLGPPTDGVRHLVVDL